jgi:hypothetical protein
LVALTPASSSSTWASGVASVEATPAAVVAFLEPLLPVVPLLSRDWTCSIMSFSSSSGGRPCGALRRMAWRTWSGLQFKAMALVMSRSRRWFAAPSRAEMMLSRMISPMMRFWVACSSAVPWRSGGLRLREVYT